MCTGLLAVIPMFLRCERVRGAGTSNACTATQSHTIGLIHSAHAQCRVLSNYKQAQTCEGIFVCVREMVL